MDYVFLDIIRLNLCEKIKIINGGIVKMKKTKGITLIALIVTIVIMLILAGVTINMLLGEDGIISTA